MKAKGKFVGRWRSYDKPDRKCRITVGDEAPDKPDDDSDVGEHVMTLSREHHHVLADDKNFYVYQRVPKRRSTTDEPSRLERLSAALRNLNERNTSFCDARIKEGKVMSDGGR